MKYNYNYLLEHQDKVLKTMPNNNSLPVIEYQIKNNFVNNHNRITYDFINSKGLNPTVALGSNCCCNAPLSPPPNVKGL